MQTITNNLVKKLAVLLGFAGMVVVNALAMLGKINGIKTADVSDLYPTLFTPKAYTFSIWGTIYLLLLVYVVFQLVSKDLGEGSKPSRIAFWFVLSCIANAGWIFAWHYRQIAVSVLVMVALLYCLSRILLLIKGAGDTYRSMVSLELPFGLYAGWITVATVANVSAFLVSLGWNGLGVPVVWLVLVLLVAAAIAVFAAYKTRNIAYPAAVIWGFTGILTRYTPGFRFDVNSDAMWIVLLLALCLLALTAQWILLIVRRVK
jgi:uncharacterized membrane protein YhaH (DUF805 family)